MTPRKGRSRIYWRERGGEEPRAYGDFRDYADVGGGQEALIPEGERRATTDPEIAEKLLADRLDDLREARRNRVLVGVKQVRGLKEFAAWHLEEKARTDQTDEWIAAVQKHLDRAVSYFGADRELTTIRPSHVREWVQALRDTPNRRGGTLSDATVRKHLNSLSNLYRRAESEEAVPPGYNPVQALVDKPTPDHPGEAEYLEPQDAALLLEAARLYEPPDEAGGLPFAHELVATFLITGGRKAEVLGLRVEDVSFDRRTVTIRPNEHRRLKTEKSRRTIPLWPQLEEILRAYVFGGEGPKSGLLFPSPRTGKMLTDTRKTLDAVAKRAAFGAGEIRTRTFRHTYTSARIQTFEVVKRPAADGEEVEEAVPVALFTVARELGHSSTSLIEKRYGHLLANRKARSNVVEYRVEQHAEELGERLQALRAG